MTLLLLALGAGALANRLWTRQGAKKRKRIPRHWPLDPRALTNSEERKVWLWMNRVFFDHHVMLKMPVTRFTLPRTQDQGAHWYSLLSAVYCTFTVCTAEGQVVGCVDVPGKNGLSRSNRQLKLTLLSQCGVAYWVLKSGNLPTLLDIRTEFLGDGEIGAAKVDDEAMIAATRTKLKASLERQRLNRRKTLPRTLTDAPGPASDFGALDEDWQQQNSFLGTLDSRRGELR